MKQYFMMIIVLFFMGAGVLLAGCFGNSGTEMIPITPSVPFTPVTGLDLTNQNSPLAATFSNGASRTPLGTPQPRIGLEKIAGVFFFTCDDCRTQG